ncbi:MAG: hypothetical protein KDD25_07565, partial [Bdellovibrionales bacterium]|nr:hypothetical protein [Bdellovibrionales bacterium]
LTKVTREGRGFTGVAKMYIGSQFLIVKKRAKNLTTVAHALRTDLINRIRKWRDEQTKRRHQRDRIVNHISV